MINLVQEEENLRWGEQYLSHIVTSASVVVGETSGKWLSSELVAKLSSSWQSNLVKLNWSPSSIHLLDGQLPYGIWPSRRLRPGDNYHGWFPTISRMINILPQDDNPQSSGRSNISLRMVIYHPHDGNPPSPWWLSTVPMMLIHHTQDALPPFHASSPNITRMVTHHPQNLNPQSKGQ